MVWKEGLEEKSARMRTDPLYWEDVEDDQELPAGSLKLTRSLIIAGALASRDFALGHHDHEFMQRVMNMNDIIASLPSTCGWSASYLNYWTGPHGKMKKLKIRLGVPAVPGDTLAQTGSVLKKYQENGECLVDVEYTFTVPTGPFCMGTATIALPSKG
jgi:hypothetical protein